MSELLISNTHLVSVFTEYYSVQIEWVSENSQTCSEYYEYYSTNATNTIRWNGWIADITTDSHPV